VVDYPGPYFFFCFFGGCNWCGGDHGTFDDTQIGEVHSRKRSIVPDTGECTAASV
jgi:hypothetical protein